jgi:hypothetical protein
MSSAMRCVWSAYVAPAVKSEQQREGLMRARTELHATPFEKVSTRPLLLCDAKRISAHVEIHGLGVTKRRVEPAHLVRRVGHGGVNAEPFPSSRSPFIGLGPF